MQVGDHSGLVYVLVIAKAACRKVKSMLMLSDGVLWAIFRVSKQGKAGLAVSKRLAIVTARSSSELLGERHSELRLYRNTAL
jgi:hypothetical protein